MDTIDLPRGVSKVLDPVLDRLRKTLIDNLYSAVIYGSAVRGDFVDGQSDVNLLLVLNRSTPEAHAAIAEALVSAAGIEPFVVSRWELPRSRRVFALKFLSIKRHYLVVSGEDPVADFDPDPGLLRFLCEQALRNLRLRLTRAFVTFKGDRTRYTRLVIDSLAALFTALSDPIRTAGQEVPAAYADRPGFLEKTYRAGTGVLTDLLALKKAGRRITEDEAAEIHRGLYQLLSQALEWVREQWPDQEPIV